MAGATHRIDAFGIARKVSMHQCGTWHPSGRDDPSGAGFVQKYFERVSTAFNRALETAYTRGDLRLSVDTLAEAGFFTASVLGLFVMLRAKASQSIIEHAAKVAIEHLEGLRAELWTKRAGNRSYQC